MIVRCPQCTHVRSVSEDYIPPTAEFATCPRCQTRFRFRTLAKAPAPTMKNVVPQENAPHQEEMVAAQTAATEHLPVEPTLQEQAIPEPAALGQAVIEADSIAFPEEQNTPPTEHGSPLPFSTEAPYIKEADAAYVPPNMPIHKLDPSADHVPPIPTKEKAGQSTIATVTENKNIPTPPLLALVESAAEHKEEVTTPSPSLHPPLPKLQPLDPHAPLPAGDIWDAVDSLHNKWEQQSHGSSSLEPEEHTAADRTQESLHAQCAAPTQAAIKSMQTSPSVQPNVVPENFSALPSPLSQPELVANTTLHEGKSAQIAGSVASSTGATREITDPGADLLRLKVACPERLTQSIEEKVDSDLQLLHTTNNRPVKELGALDDMDDTQEDTSLSLYAAPWENITRLGWIKSFIATIHMVMFTPTLFFIRIPARSSLTPSYLFLVLMGYITLTCTALWMQGINAFMADVSNPVIQTTLALPVIILLTPVILGITQICTAGLISLLLNNSHGEENKFAFIFKIFAYSFAPLILSIIPFLGPMVGLIWAFFSFTTGCRSVLKLRWLQIILGVIPPFSIGIVALLLLFT